MTARQIINKASELEYTASMLDLVQARKDLTQIQDMISGEQIQNDWRDAMAHVDMVEEYQEEQIENNIPIRII